MSKTVLVPLPRHDFDPTEVAVTVRILREAGAHLVFATPDGRPATCDLRMLRGTGLGPLAPVLAANATARAAYAELEAMPAFQKPLRWDEIEASGFYALLLGGGHAPGMREYLESKILQDVVSSFFAASKPVAAICHGVVLAARSKKSDGKSVLFGRKTTALLKSQELTAWALTCTWLGGYYRTYSESVESEVKGVLQDPRHFEAGPLPLLRDDPAHLKRGFALQDSNYLSARWPGDVHRFATTFVEMLVLPI